MNNIKGGISDHECMVVQSISYDENGNPINHGPTITVQNMSEEDISLMSEYLLTLYNAAISVVCTPIV